MPWAFVARDIAKADAWSLIEQLKLNIVDISDPRLRPWPSACYPEDAS